MGNNKLMVSGVTKTFSGKGQNQVQALQGITLTLGAGEIVSLIGPSGCGKSTLLDVIAGLIIPEAGEVTVDGASVLGRKGLMGYMPQKDVLFPWRNILENVLVSCEIRGDDLKKAREEALSLLPAFGLEHFAEAFPYQLSGGMRQRVSFLRSYLCKKEIMLLDEPFGKLDALTRMQMQQWFLEMWQQFGSSVLLVTHDIDEAILLSDRVYVMSGRPGRILAEVVVSLERPRELGMNTTPAFNKIKTELLAHLDEAIRDKVIDHA